MAGLPRSALLAAWGTATLAGRIGVDTAVRVVSGCDEPHRVEPTTSAEPGRPTSSVPGLSGGLEDLLTTLAGLGAVALRVVLPAPGDPLGLPGPAPLTRAAVDAGECVLVAPGHLGIALVPRVHRFGTALEPGAMVTWEVFPATDRTPVVTRLAEAEAELAAVMREATDQLTGLDVARLGPEAAAALPALRSRGLPPGSLPEVTPARSVRVLTAAVRLRAIVSLASLDTGGARTAGEMEQRDAALRSLDAVARRAVAAAVNDIPAAPSGQVLRGS
jgi:hypothetical protein